MADPFRPDGPYPRNEDFGEPLDPVGPDSLVGDPFDQLASFLATTKPAGKSAMILFARVRRAWPTLRNLTVQQQWAELEANLEALQQDLADCLDGANNVDDLPLLDTLRRRLQALRGAVVNAL